MALTSGSRWRPGDVAVCGYAALVCLVALTRIGQQGVTWVLVAHLALMLLPVMTTRSSGQGLGRLLCTVWPLLLLPALYSAIDILNGFGTQPVHDAAVQGIEQALFGGQPSRDWWRSAPSAFWSATLHASYLSYFVIVPLPLAVFLLRRQHRAATRYVDGVITTFLLCYACFLLYPVAGPYYAFARPSGAFVANLPARAVYGMLSEGSAFGAAFPSSHVAATTAAVVGAWQGSRRMGLLLVGPGLLLAVAVVYCQMHYAVDSLAGLLLGLLVPLATGRWGKGETAECETGPPR